MPNGGTHDVILVTLRDGHFFGEMSLVNDEPRVASVISIGITFCIVLSKGIFRNALTDDSFQKVVEDMLIKRNEIRKKRQEERFLIRKKSSRAIRVILYTRILARILLARTTRAQTNLFVSVSLEREREKIEKEREKSLFFVSVCVCVCLSAFVSREVWSFKDGRRCGNSR